VEIFEKGGFSLLRIFSTPGRWAPSAETSKIFRALRENKTGQGGITLLRSLAGSSFAPSGSSLAGHGEQGQPTQEFQPSLPSNLFCCSLWTAPL
jgi:hypothetical protein